MSTLDLTVQPPLLSPWTSDKGNPPASDISWSSLEKCSNLIPPERHLLLAIEARVLGVSGHYVSYWNGFLLSTAVQLDILSMDFGCGLERAVHILLEGFLLEHSGTHTD